MSIIITNITNSNPTKTKSGLDRYMLRINNKIICEFEHEKITGGLAQCLRDAANAVDRTSREENIKDLVQLARMGC